MKKILIFEFITGGGLSQEQLPSSLAREGLLMLQALIDELTAVSTVRLTVLLDWRIETIKLPRNSEVIRVSRDHYIYDLLPKIIESVDLVWPIAPEMDLALLKVSAMAENKAKQLLNSSSKAIAISGDKRLTTQILEQQGIAVVKTIKLNDFLTCFKGQWVIKPNDGVGCLNSYLVSSKQEFEQISKQLEVASNYIIQPYVKGESLSLSCLFKAGEARLLCCNRQNISIQQGKFILDSCEVNIPSKNLMLYQDLIGWIAKAIPGLWGYVGIDIIQPKSKPPRVLEINPRLTTSYTGINQALGFNVAEAVINMIDSDLVINKTNNNKIIVSVV